MTELIPTPADDTPAAPTQVQLYDDLRRIGELEDQKNGIQAEINEKTDGLRAALKSVDPDSLLHQVLTAALSPRPAAARRTARTLKKKTTRKKAKKRGRK